MIPRHLGMQGNAAMYSIANVWMQTFDCRCTVGSISLDQDICIAGDGMVTAAVKSLLTLMALLQQKPWSERCAQCKWR